MADYYFSLPAYERLTISQQAAVSDPNAIALSGGPGTGKSVVSLWRHILNHAKENIIRSQLLTFTTSLAYYLKACTKTQSENASNYVDSSKNWKYNHPVNRQEIIHDEAQDLPLTFNVGLKEYSTTISYGADNQQLITANARNADNSYNLEKCSPEENLRQTFPTNSLHTLAKNYRNSKRIMLFAKTAFPNAYIPREIIDSCINDGDFPRLIISGGDIQKQSNAVLDIIRQFGENETINIGILVPFERPNERARDTATADYYYSFLKDKGIECSVYTNSMNGCHDIKSIHITTYKSSKGLEFDVVIIPDFHLLTVQFRVVDWHDFYVGVTRAKSNLFVISDRDFANIDNIGSNKRVDKVNL